MKRKHLRYSLGCILLFVVFSGLIFARIKTYSLQVDIQHLKAKRRYLKKLTRRQQKQRPNIVLILFDDLGIGDIGVYGARSIRTPHLDTLARQGLRYTNFYAAAPVCSPSRAALMTGRYPIRSGLTHVVWPERSMPWYYQKLRRYKVGLPPDEITLADALQASGYKTALIGKWHLGGHTPSLPYEFGFDHFFGVLCSNDQHPMHLYKHKHIHRPHPVNQRTLTRQYTEQAISFIRNNRKKPFFLYLAHTFPHHPLHVTKTRLGTSYGGKYGDVVEELDDSTGKILKTLATLALDRHTIVIVTSDNGPWYQGSPGIHRGRKWEVFEGGVRVPLIVRWPGHIKANTQTHSPAMNIDLFPTLLHAANIPLPKDRDIDGERLTWKRGSTAASRPSTQPKPPNREFYFYWRRALYAIRKGRYKYHRRHRVSSFNPIYPIPWNVSKGPWLFDLRLDLTESYNIIDRAPKRARALAKDMKSWDKRIQHNPRGWRPLPTNSTL